MNKIWKINEKPPKEFFEQFPEYSRLTLQLLWDRNLKTQKAIDEFFNPDYDEDLHDPFLMKGMGEVVKRIKKALINKEKITIFGDYDADGVCGTAILVETIKALGAEPDIYIPDRNKEGYGLNLKAVKEVASRGTKLIITIDCGITDFEEIELANSLGVDVVIVDHHEAPEKVPNAVAFIDPRQKTEKYPFRELAAGGVAFKLAQALTKSKVKSQKLKVADGWEKWLLDLAAIATVADSMPIIGENRTIVKYGLVVLAQTKRIGLRELMRVARIEPVVDLKLLLTNLDTYTIGFIIGPRLNAAGRMGHANTTYELLTTNDPKEAESLAKKINDTNQERQRLTDKIIDEIEKRILDRKKPAASQGKQVGPPKYEVFGGKIIFEGSKDWPIGVVGLIAGRLRDKYFRPAIIFQKTEATIRGSARSIDSFNIIEAMSECKKLFENFGGHPGAAGFTISNNNLIKFKEKIVAIANKKIKENDLIPELKIDIEMEPKELNFNVFDELRDFAPFGEGNEAPLFLMRGFKVLEVKIVGNNGTHLKMRLEKEGEGGTKRIWAIGFGLADFCANIKVGDKVDIVFELIANEWNGTKELQLKIMDLRKV